MSSYDILICDLACPHCGETREFEVETKFGKQSLIEYKIGDEVQWLKRDSVPKGGRPEQGSMIAEGYTECENCGRDFFVSVTIKEDVIKSAEVDDSKKGYIPESTS